VKLHLLLALAWIGALPATADELPDHEVTLSIESATPNGHLKIGVHNASSKEIRVWTSCYSWAYFNWRVVVLRGDEMRLYCPFPNEMFTMNFPAFAVIKPGKTMIENLQLGVEDEWKDDRRPLMHWVGPKDTSPLLKDGDKIVVTYDVRWSNEANKYNAWTGLTAVSKTYHPIIRN
jgi:hypothetical protein